MSEIFRMDPRKVRIPERVIAARLGFKGLGKIPENFEKQFNIAYELAMRVARPLAIYEHFSVSVTRDSISIDGINLGGKMVRQHLESSEKITVILSTLGDDYDREIEELHTDGKELLSFFLDGIGSELVEYFTRILDGKLREENGNGSARISPGYGDLPLELNKWIIEKLGAKEFGVSYDPETFVMKPRKTITAFIGWKRVKR